MRHRLIPNFEAEAEGITTDHVIEQILKDAPKTADARQRVIGQSYESPNRRAID